jgi:hypothetical protein
LELVLEASRRPACEFYDPRIAHDPVMLRNKSELIGLVIVSGREFEEEGKLDEAIDRYFSALRVDSHLKEFTWAAFPYIADWAVQKGQTAERIDAAIGRLTGIDYRALRLDEGLERRYIFARRYVLGDASATYETDSAKQYSMGPEIYWGRLMPWERQRALRMLNLLTATALDRLQIMHNRIAERKGFVDYVVPDASRRYSVDFFEGTYHNFDPSLREKADWLQTTRPDLQHIGRDGIVAAELLGEFETWRRGTMLRLAIESYRNTHGKLPLSLDELVGPYFHEMPLDPYSGLEFRYFPTGLERLAQGKPCIWSTGPSLWAKQVPPSVDGPAVGGPVQYGLRLYAENTDPCVVFWDRGFWFPIPDQRH